MPLLHQDNSRKGGGPNDKSQRSSWNLAEILGMDVMLSELARAPAVPRNEFSEWWEQPGSPETAQTPRALVPAACFPPRHAREYASFSESAQPSGAWNGHVTDSNHNVSEHGVQELVTSFKTLTMSRSGSGGSAAHDVASSPQIVYDSLVTLQEQWSQEQFTSNVQLREGNTRSSAVNRRASFCGVVGRNGYSVLRWSGQLPERAEDPNAGFSPKLFLGGLPWDISEEGLSHALGQFGPVTVEWPERARGGSPRGFAYVTLESERRVRELLAACRRERAAWYYRLHSRRMRPKEVQVIPWAVSEASWAAARAARLEAARTVFVGALHGMLSARALAHVMDDLFGGVVYAGIDTDKHKYPIGSGRVTFDNVRSYVRAISAAYIEIHTDKFTKKVQIDPYLEDSMCSVCNLQQGPYFCRNPACFGYFCRSCWLWQHTNDGLESHKALMRTPKNPQPSPRGPPPPALPAPAPAPAHSDHGLYGGVCASQKDGTPSPATSGTSGVGSAGDPEPADERLLWAALC